jgi:hypothetical protein
MPHTHPLPSRTASSVTGRAPDSLGSIILCSVALIAVDFYFGPIIQFTVLFVLPVMWAAWRRGARAAIFLALTFAIMRLACHWYWSFPFDVTPAFINSALRAAGLMAVAVITANVAALVRSLKRRITLLEARLEVCGECGVIREPDGRWVPLAQDSPLPGQRTRCPACEERRYGSFS